MFLGFLIYGWAFVFAVIFLSLSYGGFKLLQMFRDTNPDISIWWVWFVKIVSTAFGLYGLWLGLISRGLI